jgi:inner membrane protein involved in colicin E2 resistance
MNFRYSRSYRQEKAEQQLADINKILGASENTFEPGKAVEFNSKYDPKNNQTKEEKELEDKLFELYEELEEDYQQSDEKR